MEFIDKASVLAIIEKLKDEALEYGDKSRWFLVAALAKEINSLKVKEVDLEKEIDNYISDNFFGSETLGFFANRTEEEPNDIDMALCAKHFFELGLKAQRKSVSIQNIDDVMKELGVDPYSREGKMIKENYYTAMNKLLAQKGE